VGGRKEGLGRELVWEEPEQEAETVEQRKDGIECLEGKQDLQGYRDLFLKSSVQELAKPGLGVARWFVFQTKNPNLGKFWRVLQWKMVVYFIDTWSISWPFVIFYGHLV
jgi:hypothetical protein